MKVKNKIAIITGAGTGIGKAIAIELARCGCTTVLVGRRKEKLEETLAEVKKFTPDSTAESSDISNEEEIKQLVRAVQERYGRIDILVNNAATMIVKLFENLSIDEFNSHMSTNYYGAVNLTRAVIPIMEKQGKGVIMNIASVGGKLVVPGTSAYAPSKAAMYAFSEALYYELKDKGIHIGVILPGGVSTDIFESSDTKLSKYMCDQCTTAPSKIAGPIRSAIEKERFETIVPFSSKLLLAAHGLLSGIFKKSLLSQLRPYFK